MYITGIEQHKYIFFMLFYMLQRKEQVIWLLEMEQNQDSLVL